MRATSNSGKNLHRMVIIRAFFIVCSLTLISFGGSSALAAPASSGGTVAVGDKQQPSSPHMNVWCVQHHQYPQQPSGAPCTNSNTIGGIQQAINMAGAGDEIRLASGFFNDVGEVVVDKPLILYGGFNGQPDGWGNPTAGCLTSPSCSRIAAAFRVAGAFEVILNGVTIESSTDNTNGGTITAFGSGIRLGPNAGTFTINGKWNIAAPGFIEIVGSTQVAQSGTQFVGDGWLNLYQDGVLHVEDNTTVPRLRQWQPSQATRAGHVDGPGTLNVTHEYIWDGGQMRGTGVTNLMPNATMDVPNTDLVAAGYMDYRTFNNQGTVNWGQSYALALSHGATFNNTGTFNLQENYNLGISTDGSFGFFNNSGVLRNPGPVYRQVHKFSEDVVFNNTGNIDVPDADGTLHFQIGTFNLLNGTTITGAGYAQVGDQTGTWNIVGTVNAQNVSLINYSSNPNNGITGAGTLNISGKLDWGSGDYSAGRMGGSGVTNMLPGSTTTMHRADLITRTFNNHGTANFTTHGYLFFNAGTYNNYGTTNSVGEANTLHVAAGQTGTFFNQGSGTFTKTANHNFRVGTGATFINAGTLNLASGGEQRMESGQFRQTGGITNIASGAGLWSNSLPLQLEAGLVLGGGSLTGNVTNTGATVSPGTSPGTLTINGNYTQSGNGKLSIELGGTTPGTQHDQLVVNGAATLGGTINVSPINGFTPPVGSEYTVLTYQSHTGSFGSTTGGQYNVNYNPNDARVAVTGAFQCGAGNFSDVPSSSTFYPYVSCLVNRGVMSGYSDCTFRPGVNLTRGQLSKVVSNSAGFNEPHTAQTFEDVPTNHTFYIWIQRLASRGIINGYACGGPGEPCGAGNKPYFRSGADVTRGQSSKIIAIAAALPTPPQGQRTFEDVPTTQTFWPWIESLASTGAIGGYGCGGPGEPCISPQNRPYFRPGNNVTRGQASKIVANSFFPECNAPAQGK